MFRTSADDTIGSHRGGIMRNDHGGDPARVVDLPVVLPVMSFERDVTDEDETEPKKGKSDLHVL